MKELPIRKGMRLEGYDYSKAGYYFITVCVKGRHELLWDIPPASSDAVVGANCVRPPISAIGQLVENEIRRLSTTYRDIVVDKYVIMPNHLHFIIAIANKNSGRTQFAPTMGRIIKQFKGAITKQIGESLWQRSYHDHIIRDEAEYQKIWQYIDQNPATWGSDQYNTK